MTTDALALTIVGVLYLILFTWAFRVLPQEEWQVMAAIPLQKLHDGFWTGMNLTYYGALTATGVGVAVATVVVLLAALSIPLGLMAILSGLLLLLCIPASAIVAKAVEQKPNTFTIGGAIFVGMLVAPWTIMLVNVVAGEYWHGNLPVTATLAALAIAYALGEGTGRLACISFGCCYGKPVSMAPDWLARLFDRYHFAFAGAMKKVAYDGGLESMPVIPIQGITSVLLVATGMAGLSLFLKGRMLEAFLVTWLAAQSWRAISEFLRADYRGSGWISVYQMLALLGGLYGAVIALMFTDSYPSSPNLLNGLKALWDPAVLLLLQALWVLVFLYTGRSRVTAARISLRVLKDRI